MNMYTYLSLFLAHTHPPTQTIINIQTDINNQTHTHTHKHMEMFVHGNIHKHVLKHVSGHVKLKCLSKNMAILSITTKHTHTHTRLRQRYYSVYIRDPRTGKRSTHTSARPQKSQFTLRISPRGGDCCRVAFLSTHLFPFSVILITQGTKTTISRRNAAESQWLSDSTHRSCSMFRKHPASIV